MIPTQLSILLSILIFLPCFSQTIAMAEETVKFVQSPNVTGYSAAVVVSDQPLVHTAQILPVRADGSLATDDVRKQIEAVFDELESVLKSTGSSLGHCVKLNFCVADSKTTEVVTGAMTSRFGNRNKPAVSFVVSALPVAGALVAVDAVATVNNSIVVEVAESSAVRQLKSAAVLPAGSRIYISGQAEQSDSLAESTRRTLESLGSTLKFLERSNSDIVQLKAFVMPMTEAEVVRSEFAKYFGDRPVPPLVLVEWKSSARTPIEIELIASGGPANLTGEAIEYLTPPGMTQSPIYSRLTRINRGSTIFVSGLYAAIRNADPSLPASGEREVLEIFSSLKSILKDAGSDLNHLAKATYYVATDAASMKLNELRPKYYDPARPPAASKAVVSGVGRDPAGLTIDMIALPNDPASAKTSAGVQARP